MTLSASNPPTGEGKLYDTVKFMVSKDDKVRAFEAEKRKLATASKVFNNMFKNPSTLNFIAIKDFSPRAFKIMLKHVYQKPYSLDDWELALEVFCVAEKYKIFSLQEECEDFFSRTPIDTSNAVEIYKLASRYNVQKVQASCEEMFGNNSNILLTPDFEHIEMDVVKKIMRHKTQLEATQMLALINWGSNECRRRCIAEDRKNIEKCVIGVCGNTLAISVSKVIEKLFSAKKKSEINGTNTEQKSLNRAALISLSNSVGGTIMDSFSTDIICEVKISVLNGILEFTGMELHLKKKISEEILLEIFYSTESTSKDLSIPDTKVDGTIDERKKVVFPKGLIVKSGQFGNITVRIEDLPMGQCLQNSKVQQEFTEKGIHFRLELKSNKSSSMQLGPFFIERLFYKSLS